MVAYLLIAILIAGGSLYYVVELRRTAPDTLDNLSLEKSLIEYTQSLILLAGMVITARLACRFREQRSITITIFTLLACASIREQDFFLTRLLFGDAWKVLMYSVLLCYGIYFYKNYTEIKNRLPEFLRARSCGLFLAGFMVVVIFSRLIGNKYYWMAVMDEKYYKLVKRIAEENIELAGYTIIFAGVLDYGRELKRRFAESEGGRQAA